MLSGAVRPARVLQPGSGSVMLCQGSAMKRWIIRGTFATLTVLVLFRAFIYPHLHSSRLDALEPYMQAGVSLDEIQRVAKERGIPLEPMQRDGDRDLHFRVLLDGSRSGETLYLTFRKGFSLYLDPNPPSFGLLGASVSDEKGMTVKQWFCVKPP
jgi:hypothetical protein